jgi:hypothetical protein
MGGAVRSIVKAVGLAPKQAMQQAVSAPGAKQPGEKSASQMAAEDRAARRRARRGGRGLLSETRISPEEGVSTLGQSGML